MDLLGQLANLWKKNEATHAAPTVPQPPTALEQRQRLLAAPTPMLMMNARTYDIECMRQVLLDFPNNVAEQEKVWRMLTKRSRATFFRLKKLLVRQAETDAQAAAVTDSIVYSGCAASEIPGSSSGLDLMSKSQDISIEASPGGQ